MKKKVVAAIGIAFLGFLLLGCPEEKKGTFEKLGEQLDDAAEDARKAAEEAAKELED